MKSGKMTYSKYFSLFFALIALVLITGCSGTPGAVPIINSFTADSTAIIEGESATLSWAVTDAATVTINQGIGTVDISGAISVFPTTNTNYVLTATNNVGSSTENVTITVNPSNLEQTITIQPGLALGKDSYVNSIISLPGYNTATYDYLSIGNPIVSSLEIKRYNYVPIEYDTTRTFIQFVLTTLPESAVIVKAELKLYQFDTSGNENFIIALHQVTESWKENVISWDNQPNYLAVPESTTAVTADETTWLSWDVSILLQGWLDGSISNYGVVLKSKNEIICDTNISCHSSDYVTDPTMRPKLEITYYIP